MSEFKIPKIAAILNNLFLNILYHSNTLLDVSTSIGVKLITLVLTNGNHSSTAHQLHLNLFVIVAKLAVTTFRT